MLKVTVVLYKMGLDFWRITGNWLVKVINYH